MSCSNIVIIEDDDDIRDAFQAILEIEGYSVRGFANGRMALEELRGCRQPCLILLDLMMPVMSGWEFLRERKALREAIVDTPVFIVSAIADKEDLQQAGASGYLKKPVDLNALLRIAKTHFDLKSSPLRRQLHHGSFDQVFLPLVNLCFF